jgi:hypothetical protein
MSKSISNHQLDKWINYVNRLKISMVHCFDYKKYKKYDELANVISKKIQMNFNQE